MQALSFRSDINGLRAWAVLAVIFYHFAIPPFNGGFIGVDVFFVISGFLMTGIVCRGLIAEQSFSFTQFYLSRVRRITPALTLLAAVLLLMGSFYLGAIDYKALGLHVLSSLLFLSNIVYWLEAGYFDVESHEKWLLHTWSLSVEWQFYLLLPILLWFLWKLKPSLLCLKIGLAVLLLLSLLLSIIITPLNASAAFYWLPTRAWQMLAGGLVYLYLPQGVTHLPLKKALSLFGFGLITLSIFIFSPHTLWPGYYATVPVLGAVCVIAAAHNNMLTNLPLLQWIGTRSYSLYLWHWPVVVALAYNQYQDNALMVTAALCITVLLSHLSFVLVENPSRTWFVKHNSKAYVFFLLPLLVVAAIGAWILQQQGLASRLPANVINIEAEQLNKNVRYKDCHITQGKQFKACEYGRGLLKAIVVGDSHANALVTAVVAAQEQGSVLELSYGGCPTVKGIVLNNVGTNYCALFNEWALAKINALPNNVPVIIINRSSASVFGPQGYFGHGESTATVHFNDAPQLNREAFLKRYQQSLIETACEYAKHHPVYLLRPIPEMLVNVPRIYSRLAMHGVASPISISKASYQARHAFIMQAQDQAVQQCGVKILDPTPYLCDAELCYGTKNNVPLYYDDNHLSETGNRLLIPLFEKLNK